MNIFSEILKHLPKSKIEIIPDDPKDIEVAKQMSELINNFQDFEIDQNT